MSPIKRKLAKSHTFLIQPPLGLSWDKDNYSCSYDSLFVILYDIWKHNPDQWTENLHDVDSTYTDLLVEGFNEIHLGLSLECVRDNVRQLLHNNYPDIFPLGHEGASIGQLAYHLLKPRGYNATSQVVCTKCNYEGMEVDERHAYAVHAIDSTPGSTQKWITSFDYPVAYTCPECLCPMVKQLQYNYVPNILALEYPHTNIETSHKIKFLRDEKCTTLYLRGIVYHGENHFTSRIISSKGKIWYYDGMLTEQVSIEDRSLRDLYDNDLRRYQNRDLVVAVYAQK
jgi:hypothetical protein